MIRHFINDGTIEACQGGDPDAFRLLFESYKDRVFSIALCFFDGNEASASDVTQEVFLKLMTNISQFQSRSEFSTWLHRLVVNTCRDVGARQRVRRCEPLHEDERVADDADPAREAGLAELRSELAGGLAGISPDQAKVVVLKDALDFSFAEIAEAVDMPVGTAKCYAHRARAGLRTRLKRDVA